MKPCTHQTLLGAPSLPPPHTCLGTPAPCPNTSPMPSHTHTNAQSTHTPHSPCPPTPLPAPFHTHTLSWLQTADATPAQGPHPHHPTPSCSRPLRKTGQGMGGCEETTESCQGLRPSSPIYTAISSPLLPPQSIGERGAAGALPVKPLQLLPRPPSFASCPPRQQRRQACTRTHVRPHPPSSSSSLSPVCSSTGEMLRDLITVCGTTRNTEKSAARACATSRSRRTT